MLCYEAMAGRQERLLCSVEQEDQVVGEGGLLAAQHHPSHLEHDGTAGAIVTSTWTLDGWSGDSTDCLCDQPGARCQSGS